MPNWRHRRRACRTTFEENGVGGRNITKRHHSYVDEAGIITAHKRRCGRESVCNRITRIDGRAKPSAVPTAASPVPAAAAHGAGRLKSMVRLSERVDLAGHVLQTTQRTTGYQ